MIIIHGVNTNLGVTGSIDLPVEAVNSSPLLTVILLFDVPSKKRGGSNEIYLSRLW